MTSPKSLLQRILACPSMTERRSGDFLEVQRLQCLVPNPLGTPQIARPCLQAMAPMEPLVLEPVLKYVRVHLMVLHSVAPMEPLVLKPLLKATESASSKVFQVH